MKDIAGDVVGQVIGRVVDGSIRPMLIAVLVIAALFYITPTLIAFLRRCRRKITVLFVNILLGWTVVGWIVTLFWALEKNQKPRNGRKKRKKRKSKKSDRTRKK